jgi:hypothetical protein
MANLFLTAKRISPAKSDFSQPQMLELETNNIVKVKPFKKGLSILYGTSVRPWKKYRVAETPSDYDNAQKLALGLTTGSDGTVNLAASGTAQGTALPVGGLTAYYNVVTGATAGSQVGVILPPASTKFNSGGAFVVKNAASTAISVYPAASEYIDAGASNAPVTCGSLQRLHFFASASNKWLSASVYA